MKLPPLAIGVGAGLLAALLLAPATGSAIGDLARARVERDRLRAVASTSAAAPPIATPALAFDVADAAAARAAVMDRVQRLARAGGVLPEETTMLDAPAGLVRLRLRFSGTEKAVVALADALERERPLVRLRTWRIEPVAGGDVRVIAEALAPWR